MKKGTSIHYYHCSLITTTFNEYNKQYLGTGKTYLRSLTMLSFAAKEQSPFTMIRYSPKVHYVENINCNLSTTRSAINPQYLYLMLIIILFCHLP